MKLDEPQRQRITKIVNHITEEMGDINADPREAVIAMSIIMGVLLHGMFKGKRSRGLAIEAACGLIRSTMKRHAEACEHD